MKKGKKTLKVIGSVALAVVVGAGIWQVAVHQQSKKYNMITLDTSKVPSPITSPIKEMGNGVFMQSRIKEIVINNAETIGCTCFSSSTIDTIKLSTKTIQDGAFITSKVQKLIIESECVSEGAFLGNKIKVIEFLDGKFTFDDSDNGKFEETLFIAPSGSEVEQYAKDNGLNFEALD